MRRRKAKPPGIIDYIAMRQEQLIEESKKCNNEYDKQWYNKLIAELHWCEMLVKEEVDGIPSDCWMAGKSSMKNY
jgi:hypothetical protein